MASVGRMIFVSKGVKYFERYNCNCLKRDYVVCKYLTKRLKSNSANVLSSQENVEEQPSQKDPLDLTFSNTKDAYKSKKTLELLRGFIVLKLCSYDYLVENHQRLMKVGRQLLTPALFRQLMRFTFYGQFVGGEDAKSIKPVIKRLYTFGVKSILDYSAEEDISEQEAKEAEMKTLKPSTPKATADAKKSKTGELKKYQMYEEFADRRKHYVKARTYFYLSEAQCERNMETFLKCIDAVAGATKATGFAAVKLTALGRPQLLLQLSEVIALTRKFFKEVTGAEESMPLASVSPTTMELKLGRYNIRTDDEEVRKWFEKMDYDRKGLMNLFSWSGLVDMNYVISDLFKVPSIQTGRMERIISALSNEEEEMFRNMMRRVHHILRVARERDVRVMIDAEQTYFQPAISRITMELMRKYNKEKALVFNTYQCYLTEAYNNVVLDLELAKRQNIYFGAKLVRGAYMEQERLRAKKIGYEDPINPTFEATTEMYHSTLTEIMNQIVERGKVDAKIAIMVASHNEDTIRFTVNKMEEMGILPEHKLVCFGQLLGMCDQVSFLLGQAGYSVYKYVPYGPVDEVLPYLSRRALENHGMLQKMDRECQLLKKELIRRILTGQIFHKPKGNYKPI
ncbi:proline dehydrogenase 1, mitochondrial-like [Centruroides vittatus]|uniref:proline dehydrogenase 1, mitochondrial-like n=1 Tax=Centruroides vittatus TaxID=120091 RepID=UPI00351072FA